jgi:hypothetical protein
MFGTGTLSQTEHIHIIAVYYTESGQMTIGQVTTRTSRRWQYTASQPLPTTNKLM